MSLVCEICEKEIENYSANIMIRNSEYPNASNIFLVCKPCTSFLDSQGTQKGTERDFHNIWELQWLKEDFSEFHEQIQKESKEGSRIWGQEAKDKMTAIGRALGSRLPPL
ncbi:hypothetical protein [Listeria booriae]|uniref:hypothetical protein n=1 Tax=Listeria booriae TaxID=1552123 RepID=UPI00162687A7|nr:hypothetical protein [Listeria booriae]MBC1800793.1 hypothetical protein [Listeria booriae]MBC1803765.1 hypothetical protein [Listeria booriae]